MSGAATFRESTAALERLLDKNPLIRAVNFHNTPRARAREYEQQLKRLSEKFAPMTEADLEAYLATGAWSKPKPGVIVSVYEGYRNGYDVLRPLLDRYGLVGWFFIITGFIKAPVPGQFAFANAHEIDMATREYEDGRYAMSWSELRELDQHHVVACHTHSHTLLSSLAPVVREQEVIGPQRDFETQLGHRVRSFVSYGGPAYGQDPVTDRLIEKAGYQFVFSNFRIQRIRNLAIP